MNYIFISLFSSILIIVLLFILAKKIPIILEEPSLVVRKIHNKKMINIGGVSFISFYLIFLNVETIQIKYIALFSIFFLILGLMADINKAFSANFRFILMILIIIIYLMISNQYIIEINGWYYLNGIFRLNAIYPIIFSLLCILIAINAFNIIDGQHGLMLGTGIIVILCLKVNIIVQNLDLTLTINSLLVITTSLFLFNYIGGKIKSGDCGSYFIGFIIAGLSIYINNLNYIDSFYIACILFYPAFELFFTYLRRIIYGKNPFQPDNYHLHSNLFKTLSSIASLKKYNPGTINRLTAFLILSSQSIIQIIIYIYADSQTYILFFFSLPIVYMATYFYLQRLSKTTN